MIEVLIAGDFCPQNRVCDRINEGDLNIFDDVQSIIEYVDYSIVNLECPIAEEGYTPITKQGPCLKSSESAIALLKKRGFCCTTLANNHFRDFGDDGCGKTIEFIKLYIKGLLPSFITKKRNTSFTQLSRVRSTFGT